MLDAHFVYLGAAVVVVGQAFYVVDTLRGRTQPNRVTWLLWAVAPLLAFAVEIDDHIGIIALMTFMYGFGPMVVFGASFVNRQSVWALGRLDYACGVLSVAGTIGWLVTREGLIALAASIVADALAGFPTMIKSWRHPETESASAYAAGFVSAVITLLTVRHVSVTVMAFPLYIAVVTLVAVALVGGRLGPRWRHANAMRAASRGAAA